MTLIKSYLIFVEFTVLVLLFSLVLKCDDDKTNEDVHHEESDDNDEDEIEDGHKGLVVINRSVVLVISIDGLI